MCRLCKREQEFLGDEEEARTRAKARHTPPYFLPDTEAPDPLEDPVGHTRFLYYTEMTDKLPDPPRHPSVSGFRQHRAKDEALCGPCEEFHRDKERFLKAWRLDALERVEARLDPNSGVSEDPELRAFYERKRKLILEKLAGEDKKPAREAETMTKMPSVRVPDRVLTGLKERAAEEGVSFSDLVRRALDEWMML